MRFAKWVLAMSVVLIALAGAAPAHAGSFRLVIRITSEASRGLSERIRGQTSDLSIELVTLDTGPLEASLPAQVGSGTAIAQVYDADAVVWFDDYGSGAPRDLRLLVLQPKAKRLLVRGVDDPTSAPPQRTPSESAALEAAALIVRLSVQAMMQGGVIGVEQTRIVGIEPEKPRPPPPPPPPPPTFEVGDTPSAMPGVLRVPVALPNERLGFRAAATAGYGFMESVLGEGDVNQRLFASTALSFRPTAWAYVGLRLDGRYDWHRNVSTGPTSGWVGEPQLSFRVEPEMLGELHLGAQGIVRFPGDRVPSIEFAATTPEVSVFATYAPASRPMAFTSLLGFRLDRSSEAVPNPDLLNRAQRLSIGASDTNSLLLGLGVVTRLSRQWDALAEWTWDVRIPSKGVGPLRSPMRLDAGARFKPSENGMFQFQALVEASPSGRPSIGPGEPLVIVEPRIGLVLGVNLLPKRPLPLAEGPPQPSAPQDLRR